MEQKSNIAYNSKRAMSTAALITDIFRKYLDRHKCEKITHSEELEQFSNEILDHVIIVGGFPRDILLNRAINDIDIIINLRELCKLQTNHLKKYHSKKESQDRSLQCVYWQRYLERFNESPSNVNEQQKNSKEMIAMHAFNYIFNNSFWISILKSDALLDNKLSVQNIAKHGFASMQIVNTVKYGNVNLDQQCIDMIDTFSLDKCYNSQGHDGNSALPDFGHYHRKSRQLSMSGINIDLDRQNLTHGGNADSDQESEDLQNKSRPEHNHEHSSEKKEELRSHKDGHGRLKSMAVLEFDIDDLGNDFGFKKSSDNSNGSVKSRPEIIAIEVPIYSGKVRYKLLNYDFSINTAILPLSNIIKLKEYNSDYNDSGGSNAHTDPMTWVEIIENGLGECDAIQDCQTHKILRSPEESHEHCSIEAHPITFVFWRIVRWMVRDGTFSVDQSLIIAIIKDYANWLNKAWFEAQANCDKFMAYLGQTLERECSSVADVEQMMAVLEMLQFSDKFVALLGETPNVKASLSDAVAAVKNDSLQSLQIIEVFQSHAWPVEEQLFRVASKTEEALEKAQARRAFLEAEMARKDERITDLEQQNERLTKEVRYLQERSQKNERIPDLEQQNSALLQELESVNASKMKLAINANDTIDELRKFLVEYQTAVIEKNHKIDSEQ